MLNLRLVVVIGLLLFVPFPGETRINGLSLFNLGTVIVADQPPDPNENPTMNPDCTEDSCVGLVWMYYSDSNRTLQFGTINGMQIDHHGKETLCRQLGYATVDAGVLPPRPPVDSSIPVWLHNINCVEANKNATNILQCKHDICGENEECNNHQNDLMISCRDALHPDDKYYYEGEVYLAGPNEAVYGMQVTFGVIQIKMFGEIRSLTIADTNDIQYFQDSKRDSICKQMGFTKAVTDSVYTVHAVHTSSGFNFTNYHRSSWFNINESTMIECNGIPTQCFGCCYDYSILGHGGCGSYCNARSNALVISCMYDSLNQHPDYAEKGSQEMCEFVNGKLPHEAKACNYPGSSAGFKAILAFFIIVLIALVITVIIFIVTCCYLKICCCKKQYNQID